MTEGERQQMVRRGPAGVRAFTLAELLVAMGIGSFILLIVLGVVESAGEGYDTATSRVDANVEARAALTTLADDVSSMRFDGSFRVADDDGSWQGSELSFLSLKPRAAQESNLASGDLCFVHYYTAVTRQLEGETGPYSRKLYRRLVSSATVMDTLRSGADFRNPEKDPERREDEAVAFNVVQFLVKPVVEEDGGGLREWEENAEGEAPDFLELTLRVTDNQTAGLMVEKEDWEAGSALVTRLLGSEAEPETGKRLRTYQIVLPIHGN